MSNIWELDFYSRPLLDANNKKVWELLICDRDRNFAEPEDEIEVEDPVIAMMRRRLENLL